jgi:glycosyltransferase involved in cell wall biosynthesis
VKKIEDLIVIIPALNEAKTIGDVLRGVMSIAGHVILVDDGSSDGTGQIAKGLGAQVLRNSSPQGYDSAIAAGLNAAFKGGAKYAVTCDADGQHRLEDIYRVVQPVVRGDAVFSAGVRDHYNRTIERICGIVSSLIFDTADPFCGLKCYAKSLYDQFGLFPKELNIQTLPFVWVRKNGLKTAYIPIQVRARADQPRFATLVRGNIKLGISFLKTLRQVGP